MNEHLINKKKDRQTYFISVREEGDDNVRKGYVNWPLALDGYWITHLPTGLALPEINYRNVNSKKDSKRYIDLLVEEIGVGGLLNIETDLDVQKQFRQILYAELPEEKEEITKAQKIEIPDIISIEELKKLVPNDAFVATVNGHQIKVNGKDIRKFLIIRKTGTLEVSVKNRELKTYAANSVYEPYGVHEVKSGTYRTLVLEYARDSFTSFVEIQD